jgi:acetyltransferase-like isoleucine patch superfamily enzyme
VRVAPGARVVLGDGCLLGEGCRIEAAGGTVRIGPGARIGERAVIVALADVEIGAGAVVGEWALLADAEPTFDDPEVPTRLQALHAAPICIGDGARIGAHAAVLPVAVIERGAVVEPYEIRMLERVIKGVE